MKKTFRIISAFISAAVAATMMCVIGSAFSPSEAKESVVYIETAYGSGSGFAIGDPDKPVQYIITNAHVVSDDSGAKTSAVVYFSAAANKYMAPNIVVYDTARDIAVLKLPEATSERKALKICTSSDIDLDDTFSALGYPGIGLLERDYHAFDQSDISITKGGISKQTYVDKGNTMVSVYEIDVDIASGNSGGPLVNSKGEVVGINTFSNTLRSNGDKKNYAVCIDELLKLITRDETGYVLSTDLTFNIVPVIIIAGAVLVAAATVVIIIVIVKKSKGNKTGNAKAPEKPKSGAVIVCVAGVLSGKSYNFDDVITIGRNSATCDVCFPVNTQGISGVHCQIVREGKGYVITDKGSSYGTFLGSGVKLQPNVPAKIECDEYFYLGSRDQLFQIKF